MPLTVSAVGVSASPSRLMVEAIINLPTTAELTIKNPSDKVGIYDVYIDDFSSWIIPSTSSFTLEAGETKKVALTVKPQNTGVFSTNISIVAKPLSEREFQANSGVKVPLEIKVTETIKKNSWLAPTNILYLVDLLLGIILIITLVMRIKKGRKK